MTREHHPPAAASVLHELASTTSRDFSTVETLKQLLLPQVSNDVSRDPRKHRKTAEETKSPNLAARDGNGSKKKELQSCRFALGLDEAERLAVATETVNIVLKALSEEINGRQQNNGRNSKAAKPLPRSSSGSSSSQRTPLRSRNPLRPISMNLVNQFSPNPLIDRQLTSAPYQDGCRVLAESGRVALACLRSIQTIPKFQPKFAPQQLETAMSVMITKLIAVDLEDLALKEICILKRRIEKSGLTPCKPSQHVKEIGRLDPRDTVEKAKSLPELVSFAAASVREELLYLALSTQVQVLKVLRSKGSEGAIQAALEHLSWSVRNSPGALLSRILCSNVADATRQFKLLLESIQNMCSPTSDSGSIRKKQNPRLVFEIRLLELQYKLHWWKVNKFTPNWQKEFNDPLTNYSTMYRPHCRRQDKSHYERLQSAYHQINGILNAHFTSHESDTGILEGVLVTVAIENDIPSNALKWAQSALRSTALSNSNSMERSAMLCQQVSILLSLYLQKRDPDSLNESASKAVLSLEGDLKGDSAQVDHLFASIKELMRCLCNVCHQSARDLDMAKCWIESKASLVCAQLISRSAEFMNRLVCRPSTSDGEALHASRSAHRRDLISQVLPAIMNAAVLTAKSTLKADSETWDMISRALENCIRMSDSLDDNADTGSFPATSDGCQMPILSSVSQVYWMRFQHLNSIGATFGERKQAAQQSIYCLEKASSAQQISGQLLTKLDKYMGILEAERDYGKLQQAQTQALQLCIDAGALRRVSDQCSELPLATSFRNDKDTQLLHRFLLSFPRIAITAKRDGKSELAAFFDSPELDPFGRGIVLSQQVDSLITLLLRRGPDSVDTVVLNRTIAEILEIWGSAEYEIHHLYIGNRILHLSVAFDTIVDEGLIHQLYDKPPNAEGSSKATESMALRKYNTQLAAIRKALIALRSRSYDLEAVLTEWCDLVRNCEGSNLYAKLYEVPNWITLLELLEIYFSGIGFERQRLMILNVLAATYQLLESSDPDHVLERQIDLGLQYTRLGYSGYSTMLLGKVDTLINISSCSHYLVIKWYLKRAEQAVLVHDLKESSSFIEQAKAVALASEDLLPSVKLGERHRTIASASISAQALSVESKLAWLQGEAQRSLFLARLSAQTLYKVVSAAKSKHTIEILLQTNGYTFQTLANSMASLSLSRPEESSQKTDYARLETMDLWSLAPPLFESLIHLFELYIQCGLPVEAHFYLDECRKLTFALNSVAFTASFQKMHGQYLVRSGDYKEGTNALQEAMQAFSNSTPSLSVASMHSALARSLLQAKQPELSATLTSKALGMLQTISTRRELQSLVHEVVNAPSRETSQVQAPKSELGAKTAKRKASSKVASRAPKATLPRKEIYEEDFLKAEDIVPIKQLGSALNSQNSLINLARGRLAEAQEDLDVSGKFQGPIQAAALCEHELALRKLHLERYMQPLLKDPIISVILESIACYPATQVLGLTTAGSKSPQKKSSTRKQAAVKGNSSKNSSAEEAHVEKLSNAMQHLAISSSRHLELAMNHASTDVLQTLARIQAKTALFQGTATDPRQSQHYLDPFSSVGKPFPPSRNQ